MYQRNLEKVLKSPPAGRITVIGLETGRSGGWRAAVVGPDGSFLDGAIVYRPAGADAKGGNSEASAEEGAAKDGGAKGGAAATATDAASAPNAAADASTGTPAAESDAETSSVTPHAASPAPGSDAAPLAALSESVAAHEVTPSTGETSNESQPAPGDQAPAVEVAPPEESGGAEEAVQPQPVAGQPSEPAAAATEGPDSAPDASPEAPAAASGSGPATMPGPPGKGKSRPVAVEETFVPLSELLRRHQVDAIVMANGPGIREVETLVRSSIREAGAKNIYWTKLSEAGSWIYATSKTARREMSEVALAQRSAACLARRLQDPLAQLVNVDPRLLGAGQFHHEVDQKRLKAGLRATVESAVHHVGVDLNTGSAELLALLPGMTERVGKRVVEHRQSKGPFAKREQLQNVSGLSARIYKQAVGFVRVRDGENPLDGTGIHPEMYPQTEKILAAAGVSAAEALERPETLDAVPLDELRDAKHPVELLRGIVEQFRPAARDPRGPFTPPSLPIELLAADAIQPGKKVDGVVTNVADFGAFVDIGADHDGLVHILQLSNGPGKEAKPEFKIGDRVTVFIRALERDGKRISLSLKDPRELARAAPRTPRRAPGPRATGSQGRRADGPRKRRKEPQREGKITKRLFGPDPKIKAREEEELQKLSLSEKLELLHSKYRTKV